MRRHIIFCLVLCGLPFAPLWAASDDDARRDAVQRIDLSSRQGMLIQSMTQAACFAMSGTETTDSAQVALTEIDGFETVLAGLRDGHEWMGLLPEDDPAILAELDAIDAIWRSYRPPVQQIVHGDLQSVVVAQILRENAPTLDRVVLGAARFLDHYGARIARPALASALSRAGHQRMLSQRVIKEFCFVLNGIGGQEMRDRLRSSIDEFDTGMRILNEGQGDILPPPNARILRNYRTVDTFWKRMRATMLEVADGAAVEPKALKSLMKFNASVLKQFNQAIEGYLVAS